MELSRRIIDGKDALAVRLPFSFSLADTLDCGQCFRFNPVTQTAYLSEYIGVAKARYLHIAQETDGTLLLFGVEEEEFYAVWYDYFSLDMNLDEVRREILSKAPAGNKLYLAAEAAKGIAILRQEPWEALFSFIVSQNNNIPRIKRIIECICREYAHGIEGTEAFAFPTASDIVSAPDRLEPAHTGFRCRYLLDASSRVACGDIDLDKIRKMGNYEGAKAELMRIVGVGSKVADCTLLFGMNYLSAFPIDVWIRRAMGEYFTEEFTPSSLGRYAGIAQQYIFHYARILERAGNADAKDKEDKTDK